MTETDSIREDRRAFGRRATLACMVSVLPLSAYFHSGGKSIIASILLAWVLAMVVRGLIDLAYRKLVPIPSLFGVDDDGVRAEDALQRRRLFFWSRKLRLIIAYAIITTIVWHKRGGSWFENATFIYHSAFGLLTNVALLQQLVILPLFFVANFALFFGPMMMMGISQMSGLEPGDADFGVKLDDVRGQAEAKEEIKKVVTLWQSGEKFASAGGKRERGVLFLGPPGTGKTMLAKAISTGFNSPIVLMPGSGFAQTFIGMDVIIVRFMARKARKLAAKWGGQCIIFIDEIDAVGMRRSALGAGGMGGMSLPQMPGGGMGGMMGGMGQMGLQSLLVVMDGIDSPPFLKKVFTSKINTWLDAFYVPVKRLRLPKAKPTGNQIYFVGATNVPLESLDPALVRPGRMGRHIYFRTPTKRDRLDIFDLYLNKVSHDDELDGEKARLELAMITDGYSPAKIEQACNLALTYAQHDERESFSRADILEAMVTVEAGTAVGWGYESSDEERATAVHEAGHAVTSHLYEKNAQGVRLSIKKRGMTGGHHYAPEVVERFAYFRSEVFGRLITILGAMAAEYVFYGENTQGVGGDLGMAAHTVGTMVGRHGMSAPYSMDKETDKRYLEIGSKILAGAGPGDIPLSPKKVREEELILGQAFVEAYNAVLHNKAGVEKIVTALLREKEIYGNDLEALLDGAGLEFPLPEDQVWPTL